MPKIILRRDEKNLVEVVIEGKSIGFLGTMDEKGWGYWEPLPEEVAKIILDRDFVRCEHCGKINLRHDP